LQVPKTLFKAPLGCGLPIGNLTSQFFANVYLDPLDQFVKHRLKARYYLRYCDDLLLLLADQAQLADWERQIEALLAERLHLQPNERRKPRPMVDGIDFLGYITRPDYLLVRRRQRSRPGCPPCLAPPRSPASPAGPQAAFVAQRSAGGVDRGDGPTSGNDRRACLALSLGLRLGAFIIGGFKDLLPGEHVDGGRLVHVRSVSYLNCTFNLGQIPHDKIMRSMELFATKVMPHFRNYMPDQAKYPRQGDAPDPKGYFAWEEGIPLTFA